MLNHSTLSKFAAAMLFALILAGCATGKPPVWHRADHEPTRAEYDRDHAGCNYDAKLVFNQNINSPLKARYLGEETYDACMAARGWIKG